MLRIAKKVTNSTDLSPPIQDTSQTKQLDEQKGDSLRGSSIALREPQKVEVVEGKRYLK